ncbi:MAG: peptide-methionine (S)-S-oxide reductase MsrA [Bauldia sp.]|nr:peptide-methionine (S)-S-oxide reductase MsrA [Bauldia sp.]
MGASCIAGSERALPIAITLAAAVIGLDLLCASVGAHAAEEPTVIPPPVVDETAAAGGLETAVVAGGCFWGVQAVFQHVEGVENAVSGYAGGTTPDPTYHEVSSGRTGHAESVEITYDPSKVTYGQLLQVFFSVAHDPTQLNRQGPDTGTQYRSAVFFTNEEQRKVASAYVEQLNEAGVYPEPIVTQLADLDSFYAAEDYHQDYAFYNPTQPYIAWNDLPKVENLQMMFPKLWRDEPKLVGAGGNS